MTQKWKGCQNDALKNGLYEARLRLPAFGGAARRLAPLRGAVGAAPRRLRRRRGRAARAWIFCANTENEPLIRLINEER